MSSEAGVGADELVGFAEIAVAFSCAPAVGGGAPALGGGGGGIMSEDVPLGPGSAGAAVVVGGTGLLIVAEMVEDSRTSGPVSVFYVKLFFPRVIELDTCPKNMKKDALHTPIFSNLSF